MSTPEELINSLAEKQIALQNQKVRALESNDYYRPVDATGVTSDPPTQGELDSILGTPASYKTNVVALVRDTTNSRNWIVFGETDTNDWYAIKSSTGDAETAYGRALTILQSFPGLRGLWTLGQYSAAGNIVDISGNELHLTNTGVVLDSVSAPLAPKSFFGATTNNLSHADSASFDLIGNESYVRSGQNLRGMTVGIWVRPSAVNFAQWLMSKWLSAGLQRSYALLLANSGANAQFAITNGGAASVVTSSVATSVNWMLIVGRYRSEVADISVFTNGTWTTNSTSIPSTILNSTANFQIGDNHSADGGLIGRASMGFLCHAAVPDANVEAFYRASAPLYGVTP